MRSLRPVLGLVIGAGLVAVACADEDPTDVGGPLLPGGVVRTYELVLDPALFLAGDTALGGFIEPALASYRILAGGFGGIESNALLRFAAPPAAVQYIDSEGTARPDSMPSFFGGRLVMRIDTLRSTAAGPVDLELHRLGEEWDARSATWTLRVDSGQVQLDWTQPGGTTAGLVGTATWDPEGGDSVSFAVDSQTVAIWADTTNAARGALIRVVTPDARLNSPTALLRLDARPSAKPDTVVTVPLGVTGGTFVFDPEPPPDSALRIGGLPSWRSFFHFERLDTLSLPCPGEPPGSGCLLRLDEVKVNYAALVLQPEATPPGLVPEDSLRVDARTVLTTPSIPLARSPLGSRASAFTSEAIEPARFQPGGGAPAAVEVPLTQFIAALAAGPSGDATDPPPQTLVLFASQEGGAFGFGTFEPVGAAAPPRLRLIVTVASDVEIR